MKRSTVITDRLGCAITGSALIGVGLAAAAWERGSLPVPPQSRLTMPWVSDVPNSVWWPIALGGAAIVLILVGLRWLLSHRPGQKLGAVTVAAAGDTTGRLSVEVNTAAGAAAAELTGRPHIAAAAGTSRVDRGQRIVELDVTIDTGPGSLSTAAQAAHAVHRDLAEALNEVPYTSRVLLRVARQRKGGSRVR